MDRYGIPDMEILFSDRTEKDVETEESLPEYCPNFLRIVRADSYPVITDKSFDGKVFNLSGRVNTRIIYVSDYHDKLKSVMFSEEFSHSFNSKEISEIDGMVTDAETSVVSVTAKMTSGRSLLVKNRISLSASVCTYTENQLFTPSQDDGMCVLEDTVELCVKKKIPAADRRCEADVNIEASLPAASEIIYADSFFSADRVECHDSRLEYRGTMHFHCMYEAESTGNDVGETGYVTLNKDIPVEGEIENENLFEGQTAVLYVENGVCDTGISYDPYGENRVITVGIAYTVRSETYECKPLKICTDAFCTKYECGVKMTTVSYEKSVGSINETARIEEAIHADLHNFTEITDCSASLHVTGSEITDGRLFANARTTLKIFGKGENGVFNSADVTFTLHIPTSVNNPDAESHYELLCDVKKAGVSIKNGEAVCDMELGVCGNILEKQRADAVESVAVDLDRERDNSNGELIICYPSQNEEVWNIAKTYGVSPEIIKKTNSLDGDSTGHKKMLIIP